MNDEQITALRQRIGNAMAELDKQALHTSVPVEHARLTGKRQGLALALDYLRGLQTA